MLLIIEPFRCDFENEKLENIRSNVTIKNRDRIVNIFFLQL